MGGVRNDILVVHTPHIRQDRLRQSCQHPVPLQTAMQQGRHPLITKCLTSVVLGCSGDIAAQRIMSSIARIVADEP